MVELNTKGDCKMNNTTKTAAVYCRVSTADQNCDRQERDLLEYAAKLGITVQGIYKETASGAKNDRKVRAQVMKLAQARKVDVILVTEISRWGRSTTDLLSTLAQLDSIGVSVMAQTGFSFDINSPQGKMMSTILAAVSEFERDIIRERVKSGLASARAKGKKLGREHGDNYKTGSKEETIMKLKQAGKSYRQIAKVVRLSPASVVNVVKRCG
jgi:putative DNA-invertase from lambdoid prophage Rac